MKMSVTGICGDTVRMHSAFELSNHDVPAKSCWTNGHRLIFLPDKSTESPLEFREGSGDFHSCVHFAMMWLCAFAVYPDRPKERDGATILRGWRCEAGFAGSTENIVTVFPDWVYIDQA